MRERELDPADEQVWSRELIVVVRIGTVTGDQKRLGTRDCDVPFS